jgi:hypothetical protein
LFKGGRVILIKSTSSNLSTYFMSFFPLLVGVVNRIEKLQHDILWGGIGEEFKCHLVSWSKVCSLILVGGLRVHIFFCSIELFCGEVLWRYLYERETLWRVVVDVKYGSAWGGWCSNEVHGSYRVGLWKDIKKGWENSLVVLDLKLMMVIKLILA